MKKIRYLLPLVTLPSIAIMPVLTSCNNFHVKDKLVLHELIDTGLIGVDKFDYWLCAEPLVTTKVKNGSKIVGNLQTLYGSEGYNQAVLVCKKKLLTSNPSLLNQIKGYLMDNKGYVANSENTSTIVEDIRKHLDETMTSVFNEKNTNTQTLINCNSKYINYKDDKNSYINFLNEARNINPNISLPTNPDEYYAGFPEGENTETKEYSLLCPDGAPAVGLAWLLHNKNYLNNSINFKFINPSTAYTTISTIRPDFAVLPSNAAVNLANNTSGTLDNYVWLSTITWGNLYILSNKYSTDIVEENIKDQMINKNIEVLNLSQVPGIVLKTILTKNGIAYVEK